MYSRKLDLATYNNIKAKDGKIKHSPKPICCVCNQIKINTTISVQKTTIKKEEAKQKQ